jgi:hypothetical protein
MTTITHAGELDLQGYEIPCYVTDDGIRIIASRRLQVALGVTEETTSSGGQVPGKRLDRFFNQKSLKTLFNKENEGFLWTPIRATWQGKSIIGYQAELLPTICEAMLKGRREGIIQGTRQKIIAERCEILLSGFARIGLIALIDEVTGYQEIRKKDELATLLSEWIEKENYRKWTKTFPLQFYEEIYRLRGWNMLNPKLQRPGVVARYTDDLIYMRLAPSLLTILRQKNPIFHGRRKVKHFQWLTGEVGEPNLKARLEAIIAVMRISKSWEELKRYINRLYPKLGQQYEIQFPEIEMNEDKVLSISKENAEIKEEEKVE